MFQLAPKVTREPAGANSLKKRPCTSSWTIRATRLTTPSAQSHCASQGNEKEPAPAIQRKAGSRACGAKAPSVTTSAAVAASPHMHTNSDICDISRKNSRSSKVCMFAIFCMPVSIPHWVRITGARLGWGAFWLSGGTHSSTRLVPAGWWKDAPRRPRCVSSLPRASRHHHSIWFALAAGGRDNETLPSDEKGSPCAPMILITTFPMS